MPHFSTSKGSFWWRDICKLMDLFRGIAKCSVGNGYSCCFWEDVWSENPPLTFLMPRLYSFANDRNVSVHKYLSTDMSDNLILPLSQQAYNEYLELTEFLSNINLSHENDVWSYIWGGLKYTSQKFYALNFRSLQPPRHFLWLWKSKVSQRLRFLVGCF